MKITGDVDIDFANRSAALKLLEHVPASIIKNKSISKHNTGIYFHAVPVDPITKLCSIDYEKAANVGCYKIDFLNVSVYEKVKSIEHLQQLVDCDIDYSIFQNATFVSKLVHLGNYSQLVADLRPLCLEHIAMILALIRPGKKHLIDPCKKHGFDVIKNEIWQYDESASYAFKKSHSFGYAMLVKVHAALLLEDLA